jgi:phosphoglycolate phosphatase
LKYSLVIFDMDGTLADSYPWFLKVMNSIADTFAFRRVEPEDVETLRGYDSRRILEWLGVPLWKLPMIARHARALKAEHLHEIALFPGVPQLLAGLAEKGLVLAIASSDREDNVRRTLGEPNARLIRYFACGASLFGKAAKFKATLKRSGIPAAQAIAIGDETRDAEAARQAGIAFGAVAWGYASLAALRSQDPDMEFMTIDEIAARLAL